MRKCAVILTLLLLSLLAGCGEDRQFASLLNRVDSLMNTRPDSALALLQAKADSVDRLPRSQQMRYHLLTAQAQNKAYVAFTSDSLMRVVTDYYDHHGTPSERMQAHYLLGCCYRDMGEAPATIECFKDAISQADTTSEDCDYRTMMSIYGQMADLYDKQVMPQEELEALERSGWYALKCKDTLAYIKSIELQVRPYNYYKDTAMIFGLTDKVVSLYRKYGYEQNAALALPTAIENKLEAHKYEDAMRMMQFFEKESGLFDQYGNIVVNYTIYYYYKFIYYFETERLDSAELYAQKLASLKDSYHAYDALTKYHTKLGNTDSVVKYISLYKASYDRMMTTINSESVRSTSALYDYTRSQKLAYERRLDAEKTKHHLFLSIILFVIVVVVGSVLFFLHRSKKQHELTLARKKLLQAQEEYESNLRELQMLESTHEKLISILQRELEEAEGRTIEERRRKESIQKELKEEEEKFTQLLIQHKVATNKLKVNVEHLSRNTALINDFSKNSALLDSVCIRELYAIASNPCAEASDRLWDEVTRTFATYYPKLTHDVIMHPAISKQGRRCVLASMLNIRTSEIANMLNTTPSRVSNLRGEINHLIFNDTTARTLVKNMEAKYSIFFSQEKLRAMGLQK